MVLELDVALTPRLLVRTVRTAPPVVVLVDVLRATSTITTLFSLGARGVEVARDLEQAQAHAANGRVACAEVPSGRQARGTGLPISPALLTAEAVAGHDIVLWTTNGARALRRVEPRATQVLLGCLLNASAVAEAGVALAARLGTPVAVVCAGRRQNAIPCLDDTYAAGMIVGRIASQSRAVRLTDAAKLARLVAESSGSPVDALAGSATGEVLRRAHSEADIAWCAQVDITDVTPMLVRDGGEPRHPVVLL
jgi:2-phosphosulfolactate phosphatase